MILKSHKKLINENISELKSAYIESEKSTILNEEQFKEKILNILSFSSGYTDYTIREKTAKILSKMENAPDDLLQKLKNDKNFYVKNQLLC